MPLHRSSALLVAASCAIACASCAPSSPMPNAPSPSVTSTPSEVETSACRAALVAATLDGGRDRDLTYLLDAHGAPRCESSIVGAMSVLADVGFDAFPWDPAFGRSRVFCASWARRCWPVKGAARVGISTGPGWADRDDPPIDLALPEDATACAAEGATFHFQVGLMRGVGPSAYDMTLRCEGARWRVSARTSIVVY